MKTKLLIPILTIFGIYISQSQTTITFDDQGFVLSEDITTPLLNGISGYKFEYLQDDIQRPGTLYLEDRGFGNSGSILPPLLLPNQIIIISRTDGKPFEFTQFFIQAIFGNSIGMNFTGYLGTVPVATQSTPGLTPGGVSRTITLNPDFGNVTSVIIDDTGARFGFDAVFDHFIFEEIIDNTAPSGYTVAWDDTLINATEAPTTSFTITDGEIGAVANYQVTSSGDGNTATITSSVAISSIPQTVTVDVSSLPNGVLTTQLTLTDPSGNVGTAVSDNSATLDQIAPSGYSVAWDDTLINASEASPTTFTVRDVEIGSTMIFSISNSGDPGPPIPSAPFTITSNPQTISVVLNGFSDGVLTNEITLTDPAGNIGPTVSDNSATLDKTAPSGYSVSIDLIGESFVNTINQNMIEFNASALEVGTTLNYSFTSNNGGTPVTGSENVTSVSQQFDNAGAGYDLSSLADGIVTLTISLTDTAGNTGTNTTATGTKDANVPSGYSVAWDDTLINNAEASTATFTVSNAEIGARINNVIFSSGDGNVATVSNPTTITSNPQQVTIDVSPLRNGLLTVQISITDPGNNTGGVASDNSARLDKTPPTGYTIAIDQSLINAGNDDAISFTFAGAEIDATYNYTISTSGGTETVTGSETIASATDQITGIDLSGLSDGTITLEATLTDPAGNSGPTVTDTESKDSAIPTASIAIGDPELSIGETTEITITFSEAITGFDNADLAIPNGTLSTVSSTDGNVTFTATYTPNADVEDDTNITTLNNTGVIDGSGNIGVGTTDSSNFVIDTQLPTAMISFSNNDLIAGETAIITIAFSEVITDFNNTDLTIPNGILSNVSSTDGNITFSATFTPNVGVRDVTNIITLDNTSIADIAGNAGIGTTDSANFTVNTIVPTATIAINDDTLTIGETATVTITFSEAVTGFTNADLTVPNGNLATVSSTDGNITFTATYTPTVNVEDATNIITLDNTRVVNASGNPGVGTTDSANFTIDTQAPSAIVEISDEELTEGETATVTITFSEAVIDFDNADLTIPNGTLTIVNSTDGNFTFTAIFTPAEDIEDTINIITLDNTGVMDTSGNSGVGISDSENFRIDTQNQTPVSTTLIFNKGFSPNGDGINDTWVIEGLENFPNHQIQLFNRTGNLVFRSRQYQNDWGGVSEGNSTFGNDRLPSGAYYYVIETGNAELAPYTGWIYINY